MDTGTQVAAAAIITALINWLKKSPYFPWLNQESAKLNRFIAFVLSGLATLGIHAQWSSANHSLLITGLTLATIGAGAWHWLVQFLYTHGWFKATSSNQELLELLQTFLASQKKAGA